MQLIDTHVHLNFDAFDEDLEAVAQRWRAAGIAQLVHACVTPEEFPKIQGIAHHFPEVFFAVGLHPLDADLWTDTLGETIAGLAQSDPKVVAIGEMGLDFFKATNDAQQKKVLEQQLRIACRLQKPVIIHCREAALACRDLLKNIQAEAGPLRGVMHCWSGTPEETQWFLDLGFYISFSGVVTYPKTQAIQASAQMVPGDRLLVETDCPFLAPQTHRGKRNEPAHVRHVAEFVAQLRQESLEHLAQTTTANARQLFGLPA